MTTATSPREGYYYEDEIELREIIAIIKKRFWLVVILPLIAAVAAFGVSKFVVVPVYEASAQISLGNFGHAIYGEITPSIEMLKSRDFLNEVLNGLGLVNEYRSVQDFAKGISIEEVRGTRMLAIKYEHHDTVRANAVVETVVQRFLERSDHAYNQRYALLSSRLARLKEEQATAEAVYYDLLETLNTLESMDFSEPEIALARARVIDHLANDRNLLLSLDGEIHNSRMSLLGLEKTMIIDTPMVGLDPINVRPMLNVAIALVLGGMVALGIVFILEYFESNPLKA